MRLNVWVIPNARRTGFAGRREGVVVLKVAAPAREGKANRAATLYLAQTFGVARTAVHVFAGEKARHKKFEIVGLDAGRAEHVLAGLLADD